MRLLRLFCFLSLSLAAAGAVAQQHPSLERGFDPEKVYQFGDVDSINLLNRNLVLQLPIGGSYPLSQRFSYGLTLTYNSKAWDFIEVIVLGQVRRRAVPERFGNAGLGWDLSLGRLIDPADSRNDNDPWAWVYLGPDGADHKFYAGLHTPGPLGSDLCTPGPCYSRDGSYLRMRRLSAIQREIDFPDGSVHTFEKVGADQWRLAKINDAFPGANGLPDNDVTVSYPVTGTPRWVIGDRWGRTQTVYFEADPANPAKQRVQRIEVSGPLGVPAVYTFAYQNPVPAVQLPCGDTDPTSHTTPVSLLTGVNLPDGSSWGLQYAVQSVETCRAHGLITDLTLPTRGRIHWSWGDHGMPIPGCSIQEWFQTSVGVKGRQRFDADGSNLGVWTYQSFLDHQATPISPPISCDEKPSFLAPYQELRTEVLNPLGQKTVSYFSVLPSYEGLQPTPFKPEEYGLPFTRAVADGASRFLSSEVYTCAGGTGCPQPLRQNFARWEHDALFRECGTTSIVGCFDTNRRQSSEKTLYLDDGNRFAATDSSSYDGFGHFRTTTTSGNFGAGDARTVTTQYNPNANPSLNQLANTTKWVLGTYTEQAVTEGDTQKRQFCFDPHTGFLQKQRIHRVGGLAGQRDVVHVYTPDSQGNVASERSHGGDLGSVPTSDVCAVTLSGEAYRIDHTWPDPLRTVDPWRQTSQYVQGNGQALSYLTRDETVDPATGLVVQSRDGTGLATGYEYDALGRLAWEMPAVGHDGWTEYLYTRAQPGALANVLVRRRGNGSKTATTLAQSRFTFDGLGRLFQERQLLADNSWNLRETRYDGAGNKSSVSELQPDGTTNEKTEYLSYDPFGRPGRIRPADSVNQRLDVTLTYAGVRTVAKTVKVGTSFNSSTGGINLSSATTTEVYDRQGRLWRVTEPSGSGGADVTTTYSYDEANRLTGVSTPANGTTQLRAFDYDNRGFLLSETHPEKGVPVTYSGYDARGHATRQQDGPSDLAFTYDRGEKLSEVREGSGGLRLLKSFAYGSGTADGDRSNGKLVQASRFNHVLLNGTPFTAEIREQRTYSARGGRVGQRTLENRVNGAGTPSESFRQTFTYNPLGQRANLGYPVCTHPGCTAPAPAFADIPANHPNRPAIEAMFRAGVTAGCSTNPRNFCPEGKYTRKQMALFLLRAKEGPEYTPPACVTPVFADVPCSDPFSPWVNEFALRGITAGCGGGNFCPDTIIDQGTMSVFLLRTLEGNSYQPPPFSPTSGPTFSDVNAQTAFAPWIQEVARRQIWLGCGGGNFCPLAHVLRKEVAEQLARAFALPLALDPLTPRTVAHTYANGFLTQVNGYGSLIYHPNGLVARVSHPNGAVDLQANDPDSIHRPGSITTSVGGVLRWKSGDYGYDGGGNVTQMGTSWFTYDRVHRLAAATLDDSPTGGGAQIQQTFSYDPFGNLTSIAGSQGLTIPSNPATNRLGGTGTTYDTAGNLLVWNGNQYTWDAFHQMTGYQTANDQWVYAYDAGDERVWAYKTDNTSRWTLRDLDGLVLREYVNNGGWYREADHIYRDGKLLASETNGGTRHYSLDHLGTPRLITDELGYSRAYHLYYPYGGEVTAIGQDAGRLKFTGHERDLGRRGSAADDLDYMHARFYSPITGRFLSADRLDVPAMQHGDEVERERFLEILKQPQTWNRFSYTKSNPLKYIDPDGESAELVLGAAAFSGGGGSALSSIAAVANPVGAVFLAGGVGVLAGTALNQIPGVSETLTAGFGVLIEPFFLAQGNGGGKTGRKASKNAREEGQRLVEEARKKVRDLKAKANKVKEDVEALKRAEAELKRLLDRLRKSEEHARRAQR